MIIVAFITSILCISDIFLSSSPKEIVPLKYSDFRLSSDLNAPKFSFRLKEEMIVAEYQVNFLRSPDFQGYKLFVHGTPFCLSVGGGFEACGGLEGDYTIWKVHNRNNGLSICTEKNNGSDPNNILNLCISFIKEDCFKNPTKICLALMITPYKENNEKQLFLIEDL